jgi:DNA-binding GntR family transcriptional regulator
MLVRVDTQRAYELIREKIITLELHPGDAIDEQKLAEEMDMGLIPLREAFQLLVHDNLVVVSDRHGLYVADVNMTDLEQISEVRVSLEALSARLAALRSTPDDLAVLESVRQQGAAVKSGDYQELFDVDRRFHAAVARAAHNKYLENTLKNLFGLSQRLWYLILPRLDFLPAAVGEHLDLLDAIRTGDAGRAENIMHDHVQNFYDHVKATLSAMDRSS